MKQLVVISGKGGTGKTTIASSLIKLGNIKAYADCDVDAPNLDLAIEQNIKPEIKDYHGMEKSVIDSNICLTCGLCKNMCKFDAIEYIDSKYVVNEDFCEGCGFCNILCPVSAISMKENKAGEIKLYKGEDTFSTAKLKVGEGNSGLLVTEVKNTLRYNSEANFAVIDGSPGIGCPVIASLNDADYVLLVTEPSVSGFEDLKRILEVCKRFNKKVYACLNKYDLNIRYSEKIEDFLEEENIKLVGKIPYDSKVVSSLNDGKNLLYTDSDASNSIKSMYKLLNKEIGKGE